MSYANNFIYIKDTIFVCFIYLEIKIFYKDTILYYVLLHNKTLSKNKNDYIQL